MNKDIKLRQYFYNPNAKNVRTHVWDSVIRDTLCGVVKSKPVNIGEYVVRDLKNGKMCNECKLRLNFTNKYSEAYIKPMPSNKYCASDIESTKYLIREKSNVAHIWNGNDTLCKVSHGANLVSGFSFSDTPNDRPICINCSNISKNPIPAPKHNHSYNGIDTKPTFKQIQVLRKHKVNITKDITKLEASILIGRLIDSWKASVTLGQHSQS